MRYLLTLLLLLPCAASAQSPMGNLQGGGQVADRSGTITTASASQQVMAANTKRVGCEIQALGSSDLWVAIDHAATNGKGSYWIPGGSLFICPIISCPTGSIAVWGATAGAAFTATEYLR